MQCKKCQAEFAITDADRVFYRKMDVSGPTWCPKCRQMRRLLWRNEKSLYSDKCDLCGKNIISNLNPKYGYTIYCYDCWWSDKWDSLKYAQEFDWSAPFFPQFKELMLKVPQLSIFVAKSVGCEYCNTVADCKNCYMSYGIRNSEEIIYCRWIDFCKDCLDSNYLAKCELCFQCLESSDCYNCQYCIESDNCRDCVLCFDCAGCSNCFGCVGLRNSENYVFNEKVGEGKYQEIVKEFLTDKESFKKYQQRFKELKLKYPHVYCRLKKSEDCTGNYFIDSKRCYDSYQINGSQDCRYTDYNNTSNDIYDGSAFSFSEMAYESFSIYKDYQTVGASICWYSEFLNYCYCCFNSQNCSGCVGFKKGKNSFFNKQYGEGEYKKIEQRLKEHMKKTGEWGEFFPPKLCLFSYNESAAQIHFPLTKEEALAGGWKWEDDLGGIYGKETLKLNKDHDDISRIGDDITKEILVCEKCTRNYKINLPELKLLRKFGAPPSNICPDCRILEREAMLNPRYLWKRNCYKCQKEFETTYSPDRPEKVYCEECYQKEIY